jgi:hypothetical protein
MAGAPFPGISSKRLKGLEPSTFCMASKAIEGSETADLQGQQSDSALSAAR